MARKHVEYILSPHYDDPAVLLDDGHCADDDCPGRHVHVINDVDQFVDAVEQQFLDDLRADNDAFHYFNELAAIIRAAVRSALAA